MSRTGSALAALVAATLIIACSSDDPEGGEASANGGSANGGSAGVGGGGSGAGGTQMSPSVSFARDIHPILQMKCSGSGAGCHSVDQAPIQPAHGSSDVEEAYEATQGDGITGDPVYERILARITSANPSAMMPPNYANPPCEGAIGAPGCISEAELALIRQWVEQGAPP